LGRYSGCDSA